MDYYDNPVLEATAQRIKTKLDWHVESIIPTRSRSFTHQQLESERTQDGVAYAERFFADILPDVQIVQAQVDANDEVLIQIHDGVAAVVGVGCRTYAQTNYALMMTAPDGFRSNVLLVARVATAIQNGNRLMEYCSGTNLSGEGRLAFQDNVRVFRTFTRKYRSLVRRKFLGLF